MSLSSEFFATSHAAGPFTVLTVCTGNVCRSPLAEVLLRKGLAGLPARVGSAGIHAMVGEPMTPQNQRIATDLGVEDVVSHRARQLDEGELREADLVLALTREHRRAAVELLPRASRVTFTLLEFARLAEVVSPEELTWDPAQDPADRMRRAVESAAQLRGTLPPLADPDGLDIVDPYRQSDEVYRFSAEQIIPAVNATTALLRRSADIEASW